MLRTALRRLPSTTRGLAAVALLGVVVTAGAPSVIRIRPGDTLSEIALRNGTTVAALRQLNDLPGNGAIYAGDTLRLPGAARSSAAPRGGTYTVRAGDTLSEIAERAGVSVATLRARNGLPRSGMVRAGQRLVLTGGGSAGGAGASAGPSDSVSASAAANRALLRARTQPSKAAVRRMVSQTARRHGVSPSLALAVAYHESGFQQRVVSGVNAIGVMQVLPRTGRVLSQQRGRRLDLLQAQDNITAGVLLLKQLLRSTGSERMALAGYYQGLGSLERQGMLPQTQSYIRSIGYLRPRFSRG